MIFNRRRSARRCQIQGPSLDGLGPSLAGAGLFAGTALRNPDAIAEDARDALRLIIAYFMGSGKFSCIMHSACIKSLTII